MLQRPNSTKPDNDPIKKKKIHPDTFRSEAGNQPHYCGTSTVNW